jgi:nitroreductase
MTENPVLAAIRERRSSLKFTTDPITEDQLESILEAGRWAPSGLNSQPWDFVVIRDPATRAQVGDILSRITRAWQGFAAAPVIIIISVEPSRDPDHFVEDGAVAAQNLCLAAHAVGLGSSWAGTHTDRARRGSVEHALRKLLSLPRSRRVIAAVPIGVPEFTRQSSRHPLSEIVHQDRFHSRPDPTRQTDPTPPPTGRGTRRQAGRGRPYLPRT